MQPTAATGLLGTVVGGKYEIERVLGAGGVGVVVSALHVHLGQRVALKFLLDHVRHDAQVVERFLREARAAGGLRSEHVGRVIDVATLDTGAPYLVMELLVGNDLAAELRRVGPLPAWVVTDYVLQALVGLAEAHAQGIVHRDLKPANLFLTHRLDGSPCIKVLDFGIAKATHEVAEDLTQTGGMLGSPAYLSPEQLRSSRAADVRSDIWALGAIMYELVSGYRPFAGDTVPELALQIAAAPPPRLVGLPGGFDAVLQRCLDKDPARRFQDVAALAQALVPFGPPAAAATVATIARVLAAARSRAAVASSAVHAAPPAHGLAGSVRMAPPAPVASVRMAPPAPAPSVRGRLASIALGFAVTCTAAVVAVLLGRPAHPAAGPARVQPAAVAVETSGDAAPPAVALPPDAAPADAAPADATPPDAGSIYSLPAADSAALAHGPPG